MPEPFEYDIYGLRARFDEELAAQTDQFSREADKYFVEALTARRQLAAAGVRHDALLRDLNIERERRERLEKELADAIEWARRITRHECTRGIHGGWWDRDSDPFARCPWCFTDDLRAECCAP